MSLGKKGAMNQIAMYFGESFVALKPERWWRIVLPLILQFFEFKIQFQVNTTRAKCCVVDIIRRGSMDDRFKRISHAHRHC